ncbi:PAS domain-containing protein [Belnapia sp. T6]|uniref:histidine kinase n=1 Tax=Belnapia mucosa TaxID=2804532 RepID=A0ABS1VAE6_9PROT|nr:HWE histidine kinase domain-containing protein [Belnapia mucosa]MBL6457699.1 PAS domain-containing protein [Belnapia mucosa]
MTAPISAEIAVDAPPERAACRILHLEDSLIDAELVTEYLSRTGLPCSIHLVTTRPTYSAALVAGGYDLILADYVLPDFDGLEALALARELAPDTPFIFVSGTLGEEAAVEAVRQGATDYIVKQRLARLPIAVRRAVAEAEARAGQRETLAALRESEARLRLALEAGRLGAWELDLRSHKLEASPTCRANFGHAPGMRFTYDDLCAAVHPDDRDRMQAAMDRSVAEGVDYDIEYRVVGPDGALHWVQVRGRPVYAVDGTPVGMAGVTLDVTERKLAEERQILLSREVDHRAKNALAVVQAALRLTPKDDVQSYARAVEGRVGTLARVQTLLAQESWNGAGLHTLLQAELAPFLCGPRADLDGPQVVLPPGMAQPLAMAAHELATNALKYGALSVPGGRLLVSWRLQGGVTGVLRLRWRETGGPPVPGLPSRRGFGSRVLDGTVRGQLGGAVSLAWKPSGLVCDIEVPLDRTMQADRAADRSPEGWEDEA